MVRRQQLTVALAPLLLLAACAASVEPPGEVTLLVTNTNCTPGTQCTPVEVYGFPSGGPNTPGGPWAVELGTVDQSSACLTIPASETFLVIAVAEDGTQDTTAFTWRTDQPFALGTERHGAGLYTWPSPSTDQFVPADAKGWRVTLPGGGQVQGAEACSP